MPVEVRSSEGLGLTREDDHFGVSWPSACCNTRRSLALGHEQEAVGNDLDTRIRDGSILGLRGARASD